MKITKQIKRHRQFTTADYAYLNAKGYTDAEIIAIWNRDAALEKESIIVFAAVPDIVGYLNRQ